MIEKIEITQNYTFSRYYSFNTEFVIDFIDNLAYFSYHNEKEIFEKMELFISEESYSIYQDYYNSYFKTKLCLSNEESKEFLEEYNKLNLFEDYIESKSLESHDIDNLKRYVITIYKSNSKQKYILNYPPKNWQKFNKILKKLLKFDLFNLNILNKIIDDFFYEIKQEGIYLNEKKLNLTKIYFHYVVPVLLQRDDFIIDFNKKLIKGCPLKPNFDEMSKELHNKDEYIIKLDKIQIKKLFALFEKYGVYKWNKLEYYERIKGQDCSFRWCDGYHWNLELIFEDKYVLVCGGHCEHPDTYYHFAKEVFDLIGIDLFNCQGEIDDEYTYWGEKHLE